MILDTNALSAVAEEHGNVIQILARAELLALPVVVIGEYRYGIAQSRYKARYRRWLDGLIIDCTVLDRNPIPTNDLWIAALCRQYHLPPLSRDRHFDFVSGIQRLEW